MQQLTTIKLKLQQLIKQYQQLQKENLQLKLQIEKQSHLLKERQKNIELLERKNDIELIGKSQLTKHEKSILEKRLDGYIKEINTCLSLLNKE